MKLVKIFYEQLFYTLVAASVTKTGQKKQKDILRKYTPWIFLLKYNDARSFIKRQTSGTLSDNDWYNEWQWMTMTGTTSDTEWQWVVQWMTTSNNEWQQKTISANLSFLQMREEPTTKHPNENSLNLEEDLWRRPIELKAETSP